MLKKNILKEYTSTKLKKNTILGYTLLGCKCLALGTGNTICCHQETKHTLLYLWFLKGAVCLHKSTAYLTDSAGEEADLRNKALISATYAETPLSTTKVRGEERNLGPILAEMVQCFRRRDKTIPLSSSSPRAAANAEPVSMPLYYVCSKTSPGED